MKVILSLALFMLIISKNMDGQSSDSLHKDFELNSISVNFMGSSSLGGVTYERVLSNNLIFEMGLGIVGLGTGLTYYPLKIKKSSFRPYTGIKIGFSVLPEVIVGYGGYIPIGGTFFSKYRINIGFDIGPALGKWVEGGAPPTETDEISGDARIHRIKAYGNIKLGFRF